MRWFPAVCWAAAWLTLSTAGRLAAEDASLEIAGERIEDLDWMVGDWLLVPENEAETTQLGSMAMTVRWDEGRAFLIRDATLTPPAESGEPVVMIQQRIGWDPVVDRIRSWSFSTDGCRQEATWFRDGGSWIVRGTAVFPDGTQTSSVNVYTFDGADRCTWRIVRAPLSADNDQPTRATWVRTPGSADR
ncbi:hypothetical protein EBR56_07670 [bacterium]|nr:hypothetical protein [bacterium]